MMGMLAAMSATSLATVPVIEHPNKQRESNVESVDWMMIGDLLSTSSLHAPVVDLDQNSRDRLQTVTIHYERHSF